jgi:hypothetical protein
MTRAIDPWPFAAVLFATLAWTPASAVSPPPPPAEGAASWKAIEALAPFQGRWAGPEVQHTPSGDFTRYVYRTVTRLGVQDVLLLEQGVIGDAPGRQLPQAYDVINYDVKAERYKAYLPGYRLFTDDSDTSQLATIERPDPYTLVWNAHLDDGGARRTTIVVTDRHWRERIERISAKGAVQLLSDLDLTRDWPAASP